MIPHHLKISYILLILLSWIFYLEFIMDNTYSKLDTCCLGQILNRKFLMREKLVCIYILMSSCCIYINFEQKISDERKSDFSHALLSFMMLQYICIHIACTFIHIHMWSTFLARSILQTIICSPLSHSLY